MRPLARVRAFPCPVGTLSPGELTTPTTTGGNDGQGPTAQGASGKVDTGPKGAAAPEVRWARGGGRAGNERYLLEDNDDTWGYYGPHVATNSLRREERSGE